MHQDGAQRRYLQSINVKPFNLNNNHKQGLPLVLLKKKKKKNSQKRKRCITSTVECLGGQIIPGQQYETLNKL